jgi:hypothetical protein
MMWQRATIRSQQHGASVHVTTKVNAEHGQACGLALYSMHIKKAGPHTR